MKAHRSSMSMSRRQALAGLGLAVTVPLLPRAGHAQSAAQLPLRAKSTEPAGRIVDGESLVTPRGLDQVVLHVADVKKSLQFYRKFFGQEVAHSANGARFKVVNTSLAIEQAPQGGPARIDRIVVKCEPFDRASVSAELAKLGAKVSAAAGRSLRFRDPIGLGIELLPA
jgi:catechol 2,3-dioxygenase-like lactoylglutathione lyase family enzyme